MHTIDITGRDGQRGDLQAFILTLRPRRSADPRVAYGFCCVLGVVWLAAGIFFTTMGGWPIFGFFGAEFILIAGMVHVFIRRTQVIETIEITPNTLHVVRRDLKGEESKDFPAYWAHAHYAGSATLNTPLEIRSHGEAIEIGRFLSASEKSRIAWKIEDVLQRQRAAFAQTKKPQT